MRPIHMTCFRPCLVCLVALVGACAPYMKSETISSASFEAPERCGQGPYEIALQARGSRWGEGVVVDIVSPHGLEFEHEILVGDETIRSGEVGPIVGVRQVSVDGQTRYEQAEEPMVFDNSSCLIQGVPVAGASVRVAAGPPAEAAPVPDQVVVHTEVPPEGAIGETLEATARASLELRAVPRFSGGVGRNHLFQHQLGRVHLHQDWENDSLGPAPYAPGTPIRIRFWSTVPNLLEGVTFVVRHFGFVPTVSDEEYVAHLEGERSEEERRAAQRELDRQEAARERAENGPGRRERRRMARAERRERERRERHEFCNAHHDSEDCWGPGGLEGHRQRQADSAANAEIAQRERAAAAEAEAYARPDGPPPPPRAQAQPPKPSLHAQWTPGYWHWIPREWVWIGGRWTVPESDYATATVVAPTQPPPPRAEAIPPPPGPGLVWVGGHWQWDNQQFVWVAGYWDLPAEGSVYQAPSWRVQNRGVVFVPGRWQVRIGR